MKRKGTILYFGGFELPDKNAAAQRVMNVAKAFRDLNYHVVFVGTDKEKISSNIREGYTYYNEFPCFAEKYPGNLIEWVRHLTSARAYIDLIRTVDDTKMVVFYNFPAIAMKRIMNYCRKNKIKCISDVTEWYQPLGSLVFRLIKTFDTEYRMGSLNFKCDGVIAISEYLNQYYSSRVETLKLPPLVDIREAKWKENGEKKEYTFVYAGKPSSDKERLDLIVEAIEKREDVSLCIVGITRKEYEAMYHRQGTFINTVFQGRVSHEETIRIIQKSKWSLILRENTKLIQAGFPTKVVESISCGVPVCTNKFSNISDYLNTKNSIVCEKVEDITDAVSKAVKTGKMEFDTAQFDYHKYLPEVEKFLNCVAGS
ncbi:MAG: glycosyltransferase family 4 protein [Lachnospiraceae bacterium]|nr:glycosyltransferase family 4 protein [Lachnospiraceae bacterium]